MLRRRKNDEFSANRHGDDRLQVMVKISEKCPLGKARFSNRESMVRTCRRYRDKGYYIADMLFQCERCRKCKALTSSSYVPDNVSIDCSLESLQISCDVKTT
jgi:hypothetical protein